MESADRFGPDLRVTSPDQKFTKLPHMTDFEGKSLLFSGAFELNTRMWGIRNLTSILACGAALLLAAGSARASEIKNLRIWAGPEYTRAVFDVSGPVDYKLFELSKPDRIVLDMRGSQLGSAFSAPAAKGLLKSLRAGKQGKADSRVVFDLAEGVRPKSFLLPPADKFGYRLVLDLYPATVKATPVKTVRKAPTAKRATWSSRSTPAMAATIRARPAAVARTRRKSRSPSHAS